MHPKVPREPRDSENISHFDWQNFEASSTVHQNSITARWVLEQHQGVSRNVQQSLRGDEQAEYEKL